MSNASKASSAALAQATRNAFNYMSGASSNLKNVNLTAMASAYEALNEAASKNNKNKKNNTKTTTSSSASLASVSTPRPVLGNINISTPGSEVTKRLISLKKRLDLQKDEVFRSMLRTTPSTNFTFKSQEYSDLGEAITDIDLQIADLQSTENISMELIKANTLLEKLLSRFNRVSLPESPRNPKLESPRTPPISPYNERPKNGVGSPHISLLPPSPRNSNFESPRTSPMSSNNEDTHNEDISFGFPSMSSKATAFSKTVKNKLNAIKTKRNNFSKNAKSTASSSTPPTYYELDGSIVRLKPTDSIRIDSDGKIFVVPYSNSSAGPPPREVYSSPEAAHSSKGVANAKAAANTKAAANANAAIERTINDAKQALIAREEDPKFLNTLRSKVQEIISKHDLCIMTEATCRSLVDSILEQVIDDIKRIQVVGMTFQVGPLFRNHCKVYYEQLKRAFADTVHDVFVSGEIRRICESQSGENRNVLLSKMIIDFILGIREGVTMNTFIRPNSTGRSNVFINQVGTYWGQDVQKHIRKFETDFLNARGIWESYFRTRGGRRRKRSRRQRINRRNTRRRR